MVAPLERGRDTNGKTQAEKLVEGLDALFKQEERLELVYDLEDLISASSNSFYFKDVSHRTLSRYAEGGDLHKTYLALQMPSGVRWDAAQEQDEWPNYGFGETEANKIFDDLFPPDTENSRSAQEAGQALHQSVVMGGAELLDSTSGLPTGFPREGMEIQGSKGNYVISLADYKNPSAGFNVRRRDGTSNIDELNTPLNSQPIKRFNNAFAAVRKANGPGKLDAKFGRKGSVSRQERRNLLKNANKALKSREDAIRKGAQQRAKDKWVDDKLDFINNIPNNAKDAAGRGLKRLGEAAADFGNDVKAYAEQIAVPAMQGKAKELGKKVLDGMDVLANYQNEFSDKVQKEWPKVRAQIERGVEFAKPHLKNIALDLANQAEELAQNGVAVWEAGKQFAKEKYPIIQGLIEQAKVKGTPAWNAAKGKANALTSKALIGAGKAYEAGRSMQNAAMGFMDRMKAEFNEGRRQAIEARVGAMPSGALYERDKQKYWETRGELASELAGAQSEYERTADRLNRKMYPDSKDENGRTVYGSGDKRRQDDKQVAYDEMQAKINGVEEKALDAGSSLQAVIDHVQKIKDPRNTTALPPSGKWPPEYGGAARARKLQGNLKIAGLQPYRGQVSGSILDIDRPSGLEDPQQKVRVQPDGSDGGQQDASGEGQPVLPPAPDAGGGAPALGPGQEGETPALGAGEQQQALAGGEQPQAIPGGQQQQALPGVGLPGVGLPGVGLSGGGGGGGDTSDREYLKPGEQGPPGVKVHQGESRGEDGKQSRYYLRSEAKQNRAQGQQNSAQAGPESGGKGDLLDAQGQTVGQVGAVVKQQDLEYANGGPEMANNNGMAEEQPQDDYKAMIERAVEAAKQEQAESKVRMAKAGARKAVAKAGEAEAKAEEAEKEAESNIAELLHKLDDRIANLNAHSDPRVSRILSKLSNNIDNLGKKPTSKK